VSYIPITNIFTGFKLIYRGGAIVKKDPRNEKLLEEQLDGVQGGRGNPRGRAVCQMCPWRFEGPYSEVIAAYDEHVT
jgi:hypothetical protein